MYYLSIFGFSRNDPIHHFVIAPLLQDLPRPIVMMYSIFIFWTFAIHQVISSITQINSQTQ